MSHRKHRRADAPPTPWDDPLPDGIDPAVFVAINSVMRTLEKRLPHVCALNIQLFYTNARGELCGYNQMASEQAFDSPKLLSELFSQALRIQVEELNRIRSMNS
jgi:hypothetical protein